MGLLIALVCIHAALLRAKASTLELQPAFSSWISQVNEAYSGAEDPELVLGGTTGEARRVLVHYALGTNVNHHATNCLLAFKPVHHSIYGGNSTFYVHGIAHGFAPNATWIENGYNRTWDGALSDVLVPAAASVIQILPSNEIVAVSCNASNLDHSTSFLLLYDSDRILRVAKNITLVLTFPDQPVNTKVAAQKDEKIPIPRTGITGAPYGAAIIPFLLVLFVLVAAGGR